MLVVESAAFGVGKVVVARAARLWLAGKAAEKQRNAELVDLIRLRFRDRIVQRRTERQLADIADSVAERLLKLCGHEFRDLVDNDVAAVLIETGQTLEAADLSDTALLAADADPIKLARRIRSGLQTRNKELELGEAGGQLYRVLIDECCDCLVRIIKELPQFGPRMSTETLTRLSSLAASVHTVLERLPARSLNAPEGTANDSEFERRYLEHISVALDYAELFGLRVERYRPRTTLSVAYISLTVSADGTPANVNSVASRRHRDEPWIGTWRQDERLTEAGTVRVETALNKSPRIMIRGEAGSGKSTLLRWLAVTASRGSFKRQLTKWNESIPFLVKLRSHAGQGLPSPEDFLLGVADSIKGLMPAGWVHRQLLAGRALLLVDGVDELSGAQRRSVRPWLADLLSSYPAIQVVVTSRPAAAGADWLAAEGFDSAFLERMSPADLRSLVRHWHAAVRDAGGLPCRPDELPAYEAALLARFEAAPHLRALAGTPLLAAMLCALNLDRVTQLPRDRMSLYAAALEMLLERRDAERRVPSFQDVTLEPGQKIQLLQGLAWRLSMTNRSELPKGTVLQTVSRSIETMPRVNDQAEAIVEYLLQRSGVLREPIQGRIDFVHRTIQEYLTAKELADDGDMDVLIKYAHRDQWHETVVMAAGHANGPLRRDLLTGLLERIRHEPRHARALKLLVAACLETLQAVPGDLGIDIEKCLSDLIPPRDLISARSLATAGDAVLTKLPESLDGLSPGAARATVRTAWLVNGQGAIDSLSRYGRDRRSIVQDELILGWKYFDPEEYAKKVLADAPLFDGRLTIEDIGLLSATKHLSQLRHLCVEIWDLHDLSLLDEVKNLSELSVGTIYPADLAPLVRHASSLASLAIESPLRAENLPPLLELSALADLSLTLEEVSSLDLFGLLRPLSRLSLDGLEEVNDFAPLIAHTELESLSLGECTQLSDIRSLPNLTRLKNFSCSRSSLDCGLARLITEMPRLQQLSLDFTAWVSELDAIPSGLDYLRLWGCKGVRDIQPLARCSELRTLDLDSTAVSDITPVAGLINLQSLWLKNCAEIGDLTALAGLHKLRTLYIQGIAPGTDLSPLAGIPDLRVSVYIDQHVEGVENLRNPLRLEHNVRPAQPALNSGIPMPG